MPVFRKYRYYKISSFYLYIVEISHMDNLVQTKLDFELELNYSVSWVSVSITGCWEKLHI